MLDRSRFGPWTYSQPGNQCVLAAYAASLWPATNQPASEYFDAYCRHFGLPIGSSSAEAVYDADFHVRSSTTPGGGFGVIHCLHTQAGDTVFANARSGARLVFFPDGAAAWPHIEVVLRSLPDATAQIFINDNPGSPFARMHSVSVSADGVGLYAYDSNPPGQIVSLPGGKSQLGLIGNAFLFEP